MLNLFSKTQLGIDIGTGQIKIVELQKNKDHFELKNYAVWTLAVDSDEVIQASSLNMLEEDVAKHLKNLLKKSGIKSKEAVMSLPAFSAFSTVVEMPKMLPKELNQAIEFEARHYIPIPLKEVHLDWAIIRDSAGGTVDKMDNINKPTKNTQKQEVLIAAVPNDLLNKYEGIARRSGIKLKVLELETFALTRVLASGISEPVLIIDLGKRSTSLNIVEQEVVFLSRNLDTASNEISRSIANSLGISFERAENIKKTIGMSGDANIKRVISVTLDMIINEAERIQDTYYQKYQKKPAKVILSGGSSNLKGLKEYLTERLKMEVELGNPWKKVSYPPLLEPALRDFSSTLSIATGLAMRIDR